MRDLMDLVSFLWAFDAFSVRARSSNNLLSSWSSFQTCLKYVLVLLGSTSVAAIFKLDMRLFDISSAVGSSDFRFLISSEALFRYSF